MRRVAVLAALLLLPAPLVAQWLDFRTPGIPRTADGRPNLTAPAPRTHDGKPDLSGTWQPETNPYRFDLIEDPNDERVFRPAAEAVFLTRVRNFRRDDPVTNCLPGGPVNVSPEGKEVLPPKEQVYSSIEGLIQHFELIMTNRGFEAPKGEVYGCIESGNGELGYYIVSAGESVPWRVRTRPCSYINYQSFGKQIEGHMISDVVAVLGSINVIAAELDR